MGTALEWLGPEGCRHVAEAILVGVDTRRSRGTKLSAHCPFHTETSPGGAFDYDCALDAGYCLSCGQSGDLIDIWCALQGVEKGDTEAFLDFRKRFAPDASLHAAKPRTYTPPAVPAWSPRTPGMPSAIWQEHCASWVRHSRERLFAMPEVLADLAAKGLPAAAVRACGLGWNDSDKFPPVTSWGLPFEKNEQGKERRLFLPAGLTIPYAPGGVLRKVKVRRLPGKDPRYQQVRGSWTGYSVYGRRDSRAWLLIETERDAAMAWWWCRGLGIGAMSTGSASARPDAEAAEILRGASLILNCLDFDQAGAMQVDWWAEHFPATVRWPVPPAVGKDPGDLAEARGGEGVRAWAWAGVPSHVRHELARRNKPVPPEPAPPEPAPEPRARHDGPVADFLAALAACPRHAATAESSSRYWGLRACEDCPANPCPHLDRLSSLLFGPAGEAVADFIESCGGRLTSRDAREELMA